MKSATLPLIVIIGPTASGKSALAFDIARHFDGELVCADSRTIYRGMDIGTAKPTAEDREIIPHHGLDVVYPDQVFTAADFKILAERAIVDISLRGKVPVMVGGSGLYVDSVIFDFAFRGAANTELRKELEGISVEQIQEMLKERNIPLPSNERNPRHLIRALESGGAAPSRNELRNNTLVIGLDISPEALALRINHRVDTMLQQGLQKEVEKLSDRYGWGAPGMQSIGYREWREYFDGSSDIGDIQDRIKIATRQYAKRQRTWYRRNECIHWHSDYSSAVGSITTLLNKTV